MAAGAYLLGPHRAHAGGRPPRPPFLAPPDSRPAPVGHPAAQRHLLSVPGAPPSLRALLPRSRHGRREITSEQIHVELTFTAIAEPNYLGDSHLDQPGRYEGDHALDGEEIPVDAFGFRDRSWGPRSQFGKGIHSTRLPCPVATATPLPPERLPSMPSPWTSAPAASPSTATCSVTGSGPRWRRDRRVSERDARPAIPLPWPRPGRRASAGSFSRRAQCLNGLGLFLNPNLYSVNCLTEWTFDGVTRLRRGSRQLECRWHQAFLRSLRSDPTTTHHAHRLKRATS